MNPQGLSELNPERLTSLLEQHRREILTDWVSALQQKWAGQAERLARFEQKLADHEDLFSILRACSGKTDAYYQRLASLINLDLITSPQYSVLEAFDQIVLLKDAILHLLSRLDISQDERAQLNFLAHEQMFALAQGLLCGTKEFLSSLVDGGMRGYCQLDETGRIVCTDQKFHELLNREPQPGEPLDQLFIKDERDPFTNFFSGQAEAPPGPQQIHLQPHKKEPILVGAELCPLVLDGQQRGWYACLVDLTPLQDKERELYNQLPVGLVKVDLKGKFRFANRRFLEILGIEDQGWQGRDLWEFLPDKKNQEKVKNEIKKRRLGQGNEYVAAFTRKDRRKVPVKIYAVPERDLNNNIIGSLGIIRSLEQEKAIAEMNKYMGTVDNWQDMLVQVIRGVKPFVPYDLCVVSEYSSDQKHLRRLITEPPLQNAMSKIGRWKVPDKLTQWLTKHRKIYFDDLKKFLSRPEFAGIEEEPEIQDILQRGFLYFLRLPIIQDQQPIASLTFLSKTSAYNETHEELLKAALPVDKAVHLALSRHKEEEFNFFFKLIQKISEGKEFREVAKILVDELGEHYGWGNVTLFRADKGLNRFLLLEQKNKPGTAPIPENYEQPLNQGVLGRVYETRKAVNVGNVKEELEGVYISPWPQEEGSPPEEVNSELCLPLATENACFFLNIEDPKFNAFSEEEVKALELFAKQAKAILERSWGFHAHKAALELISDAVIWTDQQGKITDFNPTAGRLLGYSEEEAKQKALGEGLFLKDYFQDAKLAQKAISTRYFPPQKVLLQDKGKEPVNLLLSASALPEEFGGKIFTGKNLDDIDRMEHLGHLEKLYQEIAIQMKTPLSLAFAWLKRLIQKEPQSEEAKTLDKVVKQLRKVDLTFDRLSLYDYDEKQGWSPTHKLLVSLKEVLHQVKSDLPESDWQRIDYSMVQPPPTLWGDLFQLTFCVETILAHLLEVMPEDERVQADFSSPDGRLMMKFSGICPETLDSQLSRSLAAIALGENIISRFMANHGGEYRKEREGNRMVFRLSLPTVKGEQP